MITDVVNYVMTGNPIISAANEGGNAFTDALGLSNRNQINAANQTLSSINTEAQNVSDKNKELYNQYLQKMQNTYGANAGKYDEALANYEQAIGEGYDTFTPSGSVNDFYDKFANQRAQQATNAITNSKANAGNMFSSDYVNQLAAKQQALASEEWSKAYDKYNQNLQNQMAVFNTNASQKQNYLNNLGNLTNQYGQDRTAMTNAYDNYLSNLANQNNTDLSNYAQIMSQLANNEASKKSGLGSIGGILGNLFG